MPKLRDYLRAWRNEKKAQKAPKQPLEAKAAKEYITADTRGLIHRAGLPMHKFSLSWDDAEQAFTMLGDQLPIYTLGFQDDDLDRLLRASAWSWASINGNARTMGQLRPIVEEKRAGKWEQASDAHPLWGFLEDPLGKDDTLPFWSWQHFVYVMALHYFSVGNSFLIPIQSATGLSVVPLMYPHRMDVLQSDLDKYGAPTKYTYQPTDTRLRGTYLPSELINIQAPSPSSMWRGSCPLRAALRSTEIDFVATERQRYNLRNRGGIGPIISMEYLGPTEDQRQKIKAEIENDYTAVEDHGKPLILGGGAKIDRGFNSEELQVFDTKNAARDEIIATIGTQPSILGQLDRATYSNTKEATILWFNASIHPVLSIIYGAINAQSVRRIYPDARLSYALSGSYIGLHLMSAALDVAERLQKLGYTTNAINTYLEMGLPYADYLDKSTPASVIAGREDGQEQPPEDDDADPATEETV